MPGPFSMPGYEVENGTARHSAPPCLTNLDTSGISERCAGQFWTLNYMSVFSQVTDLLT